MKECDRCFKKYEDKSKAWVITDKYRVRLCPDCANSLKWWLTVYGKNKEDDRK